MKVISSKTMYDLKFCVATMKVKLNSVITHVSVVCGSMDTDNCDMEYLRGADHVKECKRHIDALEYHLSQIELGSDKSPNQGASKDEQVA